MSESVNVPAGDYAPEVVEAEAVPSPEPAETVEQPETAPVVSKPAPTKPQPVQQEGVTIVEPAPAPKTWTGEDGRTYAPNPLDSSPAAPPVIVEPEPTGPGDFVAPPPPPTPGG